MMTIPERWTALSFPDSPLELIAVPSGAAQQLLVTAQIFGDAAPCPACQTVSSSFYSHHPRTLAALPCLGRTVHLPLG